MKTYLVSIVFIFTGILQSTAAYTVYFFTGNVEIVTKNKPPHVITKINEVIQDNDVLKIGENSEVILKNSPAQYAIIHASGEYTNSAIAEEFKKQQGKSLVSSLAGFLGSEISKGKIDERKMAESYMKQKGGVTRGGSTYPLMVWPAYGSINEGTDVKLIWNSVMKVDSYQVIIFGGEDANTPVELARTVTSDTFMDVDFKDFGLTKDAYFSWVAYPKGDPNHSRFTFKIITAQELKTMLDEINLAAAKVPGHDDKLLIKASGFEKNGLIAEADKAYKELLANNSGGVYQDLYTLFRLRNNLVK